MSSRATVALPVRPLSRQAVRSSRRPELDVDAIQKALAGPSGRKPEERISGVGCSQEPLVEHDPGASRRHTALGAGVPPLGTFYIYMTEGCNLGCQHCWITPQLMKNDDTGGHVPLEKLLKSCRDALPLGLQGVKLTGGEPLLYPDFTELVYGVNRLGLNVWMESNLTLLTPEKAGAIRDTMSFLSTSLDAPTEEAHDRFRGIPGSFQSTCQAIRLLAPHVRVQVIMSVHKGNADGIEDLIRLSKDLGAASVKFNLIHTMGRADKMQSQERTLDVSELIRLGRRVEAEWERKYGIATFWSWPPAFQPIRKLLRPTLGTCGIHSILGILASGHYALCGIGSSVEELTYGTLEDDLVELWNRHKTLTRLRVELPEQLEGVCGKCMLKRSCKAHCVASNYHSGQSLKQPNWFCEDAFRKGLFPVHRLAAPYDPV